jgi:hypothetical protein
MSTSFTSRQDVPFKITLLILDIDQSVRQNLPIRHVCFRCVSCAE